MKASYAVARIFSALFPLALSPIIFDAIAEGRVDLGGGEKDLVWAFLWLFWSLGFAIGALAMWAKGRPLGRSLMLAGLWGFVGMIALIIFYPLLGMIAGLSR